MTIPELLQRMIDASGKNIPDMIREWHFRCSQKTIYNRLNDTSPTVARSCDVEILAYAWHNGFAAEALAVIARSDAPPTGSQRAAALFPDLSLGEFSAIADILRMSPNLVLANDAIRAIVERRRREAASSTFPGS